MCQDIGRYIYFHAMRMGKCHTLSHFLTAEILRLGPQSESLTANVYSVCSEHHRSP